MTVKSGREWPKKCSLGMYVKHWYVNGCKQNIINWIKAGHLPGGQEYKGGPWYIWVNDDLSPANGYTEAYTVSDSNTGSGGTGNALADEILKKHRA